MKFSIITPTLLRPSLMTTCQSIESQSFTDWQHIVVVDVQEPDTDFIASLQHPNRQWIYCGTNHSNGGNTCRHSAYGSILGEWVYYLDDDNYLSDTDVLRDVSYLDLGQWNLLPILRYGDRFFNDPPGHCGVDTGNLVIHKNIAQWPNIEDRDSDWALVEKLLSVPYRSFPGFRPVMIMPLSSFGA